MGRSDEEDKRKTTGMRRNHNGRDRKGARDILPKT